MPRDVEDQDDSSNSRKKLSIAELVQKLQKKSPTGSSAFNKDVEIASGGAAFARDSMSSTTSDVSSTPGRLSHPSALKRVSSGSTPGGLFTNSYARGVMHQRAADKVRVQQSTAAACTHSICTAPNAERSLSSMADGPKRSLTCNLIPAW